MKHEGKHEQNRVCRITTLSKYLDYTICDEQCERLPSVASLTARFKAGAYRVKQTLKLLKQQALIAQIWSLLRHSGRK